MNKSLKSFGISAIVVSDIFVLMNPSITEGGMGGMGGMGHGMMHPGMNETSNSTNDSAPVVVNPSQARNLVGYVQNQHLQCMQCHAVSKTSIGPSLASISARYLHRKDATQMLGDHIAHGIGRMPPGLATEQQAHDLTRLILGLADESEKSVNK